MRRAEGPFGIPARVYWKGKGGAGMANYDYLLNDLRKRAPPPDLLIFHLLRYADLTLEINPKIAPPLSSKKKLIGVSYYVPSITTLSMTSLR